MDEVRTRHLGHGGGGSYLECPLRQRMGGSVKKSYHGFMGLDAEVVAAITSWIKAASTQK